MLAFFQQEGRFYLIQQFIDGQDLLKELNQNGKFSESQIYHLLRELLPVLEFIHSHGIIHRDIKPDNIIRNSQGNLVLIDFGVSKLLGGSILTSMGTITGTPSYAPPEQMRGIVYPASDLYSLGVTCIRLLTGCLPKQDGSDELFDPINLQWKWRTKVNVSSDLADLIDHMVERLPRQRPTNASEVLQALTDQQSPRYKSLPTLRLIPQLITQPNRSLNPAVSFPVIKIFGIGVMAITLLNSSSHKTISTAEYMSSSNIETSESTNPIIKCSTPYYFITVTKNKDQGYIYTAYEITVSNSTPSLVLSGQKEDDTKMKKYIFKNGLYSYVIYQKFEGSDSQIYLQINQPGKRPIQSICQRVV